MIVLMGRSGTGKSTIAKELEKLGYERVITYTTRPPRPGEKDGLDYHFITDEQFQSMNQNGEFGETDCFLTEQGIWQYGSAKRDYKMNSVIILTPKGKEVLSKHIPTIPMITVLLMASQKEIVKRLKDRGDSLTRIKNRLEQDEYDFGDLEQSFQSFSMDMKNVNLYTDMAGPADLAEGISDYYNLLQYNKFLPNLCGYRDIIYISHAYQNNPENLKRIQTIIETMVRTYPHNLFLSPVNTFGFLYDMVPYEEGLRMCTWMLEQCTEMWVFDDYKDSVGVNQEIEYCKRREIPVRFFNPEGNLIKHD